MGGQTIRVGNPLSSPKREHGEAPSTTTTASHPPKNHQSSLTSLPIMLIPSVDHLPIVDKRCSCRAYPPASLARRRGATKWVIKMVCDCRQENGQIVPKKMRITHKKWVIDLTRVEVFNKSNKIKTQVSNAPSLGGQAGCVAPTPGAWSSHRRD